MNGRSGFDSPWHHVVAALGVVAAVLLYLDATPCPQVHFGHDLAVLVGMGQRWLQGLRPHADFYSPFGPLPYALFGFGLRALGGRAEGIAWVPLLLLGPTLALAVLGTLGRPGALARAVATLNVGFLILSPRMLHQGPAQVGYAMNYNRFAFAALVVLQASCLLCFGEAHEALPWRYRPSTRAAFTHGLLTAVLLGTKLNFGMIAVALTLLGVALQPALRRRAALVALAAGLVAVGLPCLAAIRWDAGAMLRDLRWAGLARSAMWTSEVLDFTLRSGGAGFAAPVAVAAALAAFGRLPVRERYELLAIGAVGSGCSFVVTLGNAIGPEYSIESPLTASLIALLLVRVDGRGVRPIGTALAALVGLATLAVPLGLDVAGFRVAASLRRQNASREAALSLPGERWRGMPIIRHDSPCWRDRAHLLVRSGVDLIAGAGLGDTPVVMLDFSDPVTIARGAPFARGVPPFWQGGINISRASQPPPAFLFRATRAVLLPNCPDDARTVGLLWEFYRPYLTEHFRLLRRTQEWTLLVRR